MNEENGQAAPAPLATRHLCTVEFEVGGGIIGIVLLWLIPIVGWIVLILLAVYFIHSRGRRKE